ncbi:MAG: tRNA (adenosine(37)-N6)-threonylcarbamoyltransferase complex dimerization subunit type 1 TsaB [Luteolibacter sp.]
MTDEICLILETSTRHGSAALASMSTNEVLDEKGFESDRNHNALMFGPLEEMLAGSMASRIKQVIAGAGPGSYSGTRVGIAVAQGIAIARGCPAIAMPSLVGLKDATDHSLAIGDARRGHWWWARLRGRHMESPAPTLGDADELRQAMDTMATSGGEIFTFENPEAFGSDVQVVRKSPHASALWLAWLEAPEAQRMAWAAAPPQPCYLKPPHITAPKRPWLQA